MSRPEFHDKLMEFLSNAESADDAFPNWFKSFLDHCDYIHGDYTNDIIFESLLKNMQGFPKGCPEIWIIYEIILFGVASFCFSPLLPPLFVSIFMYQGMYD